MMDVVEKQFRTNWPGKPMPWKKKRWTTMKKNGLIIHEAPADSLPKWKEAAAKGMDELIGKIFSREIYEKLQQILQEYRRKNEG